MTPWLRARGPIDRAVAAMLAVVLSPLVTTLLVLIRRHDKGRALIRLERIGHRGQRFRQWKLRTMRADNGLGLTVGLPITSADDPRITPLGRRLRRYRLDELPQLLNVIAGEMALLGPRPETPAFVDLSDRRWRHVLEARPGIAGPTQVLVADWEAEVVARSEDPDAYRSVVLPLKLAIDEWYLGNASPWVDVLVVTALIQRFMGAPEQTGLYARVTADVPELAALRDSHGTAPLGAATSPCALVKADG